MVRASVIRVRGGSGDTRVRKNGQTMNQFVQVTLLKITSYVESVKREFIQTILIIRISSFRADFFCLLLFIIFFVGIESPCTVNIVWVL